MIKSLKVTNLRGIADGQVDDLTKVNVLVGPNNSGKSTLLDALLLGTYANPDFGRQIVLGRRHGQNVDPSAWLLYRRGGNRQNMAEVEVTTESGLARTIRISMKQSGDEIQLTASQRFPEDEARMEALEADLGRLGTGVFANPGDDHLARRWAHELSMLKAGIAEKTAKIGSKSETPEVRLIEPHSQYNKSLIELYTQVAERNLLDQATGIVTSLVGAVEKLMILAPRSQPAIHLNLRDYGAQPLESAGDGVQMLVRLSFELSAPSGGLVLIEEPETHMHPAGIYQAARAIHAAAQRGIQIVATTHNLEFIDLLLTEFHSDLGQLAVYRTKLDDGKLLVRRWSGSEAMEVRTEISEDLR